MGSQALVVCTVAEGALAGSSQEQVVEELPVFEEVLKRLLEGERKHSEGPFVWHFSLIAEEP